MTRQVGGVFRNGLKHTHACSVPGCKTRCECDADAIVDDVDEDGHVSGHMSCEELACDDWLCEDHALNTPCDYCGSYGHDSDECADELLARADHDEREADHAHNHDREASL